METEDPAAKPPKRTWRSRIRAEVRERPIAFVVLGAFVVAGPVLTKLMFPEAPLSVGIVGGLAFGVYAAICAVPDQFI